MNLEQGIIFANKLLLVGWGDDLQPIVDVRLSDSTGEGVVVQAPPALALRKRASRKENAKNAVVMNGFVIPIQISEILTLDFARGGWSVVVRFENGEQIMSPDLRLGGIDVQRELGATERALLDFAVKSGIYDPAIGQIFEPSTTWMPDLAGLIVHIDHQLQSRTGQF